MMIGEAKDEDEVFGGICMPERNTSRESD